MNYINEYFDQEMLKILVDSIDSKKIKNKIVKDIKNDKFQIVDQSIFVSGEPISNTLEGYFVYTLTSDDNDKYIYHNRYYIGKFKYSLNKNKLIDYTESTKHKFKNVKLANQYIETELQSVQLEIS